MVVIVVEDEELMHVIIFCLPSEDPDGLLYTQGLIFSANLHQPIGNFSSRWSAVIKKVYPNPNKKISTQTKPS